MPEALLHKIPGTFVPQNDLYYSNCMNREKFSFDVYNKSKDNSNQLKSHFMIEFVKSKI